MQRRVGSVLQHHDRRARAVPACRSPKKAAACKTAKASSGRPRSSSSSTRTSWRRTSVASPSSTPKWRSRRRTASKTRGIIRSGSAVRSVRWRGLSCIRLSNRRLCRTTSHCWSWTSRLRWTRPCRVRPAAGVALRW
jgi:hypothetical protein